MFHGGFSTFVAVFALVSNSTYVGLVFFRLWFGIIFFGLANGFLLLPVTLSFIGPTHSIEDHQAPDDGETKPQGTGEKVSPAKEDPEPDWKGKASPRVQPSGEGSTSNKV